MFAHYTCPAAKIGQGIGISAPDLLFPSIGMYSLHCSVTSPTLVPEPFTVAIVSSIETLCTVRADAFSANRAIEDHSCSLYRCYMAL